MNILMTVIALFALAALGAYLRRPSGGVREMCANGDPEQPHVCGRIGRVFADSLAQPYLLTKVAAGGQAELCGATDEPLGPCLDTPLVGERATILHLGAIKGTLTLVAAEAVADGERVYTAAGGQVSVTAAGGSYLVGRAVTAAAGAGQNLEVVPCFPVPQ